MWKGIELVRKNLINFGARFTPQSSINLDSTCKAKSSEEILEEFVLEELENFNFKKNKREKSLAILSLNLIQLFYEHGYLQSLEDAANMLSGGLGAKFKTKVRRLYDITNVFKALGLVKKTTTVDKKVAIEWLGLNGFEKFASEQYKFCNQTYIDYNQKVSNNNCNEFLSEKSAFNIIAPVVNNKEYSQLNAYGETLKQSEFFMLGREDLNNSN